MHRSASLNWVSKDYYMHGSWPSSSSKASHGNNDDQLPLYDPLSEPAKTSKERSRLKFAENAVHIIPFVLLLCALILWIFSNPDVNVGLKSDSITARIEGLTIEGDIDSDSDSDGTQTSFLPALEDQPKHMENHHHHKASSSIKFGTRSI